MTAMSVRVYAGPDAMRVLASQRRELYAEDKSATHYQSPAWLTGWARQLPRIAASFVLAAMSATGRILAALALARHDDADRPRILPPSAPHAECVRPVGPYADDPAIAQAPAFQLLLADGLGADVVITDVPTTGTLGSCLTLLCEDTGCDRATTACAVTPMPLRYGSLPPSAQRAHANRIRTWSGLAHKRNITYTRTRHAQELLAASDVLYQLHQRPWEGHDPLPGSLRDGEAGAWQGVLRHLGTAHASIAGLAVNGTVITAQLLLIGGARCYSLSLAINPVHHHRAPGHALMRLLVDDLTDEGFHTRDLGRTSGPQLAFKRQYAPQWTSRVPALSTSHRVAA
jgi:hypothetical protein